MLGTKSVAKLKSDAIPTLFTHMTVTKKRLNSEIRTQKAQKRMMLDAAMSTTVPIPAADTNSDFDFTAETIPELISKETQTPCLRYRSFGIQCGVITHEDRCSQTKVEMCTVGTDTSMDQMLIGMDESLNNTTTTINDTVTTVDEDDCDYQPSQFDDESEDDDDEPLRAINENTSVNYIVFWPMLVQLLTFCLTCKCAANITKVVTRGSQLFVTLYCSNNHETTWKSQPSVHNMGEGNLLMSAAILFSGNSFSKISELFSTAKITFFSKSTYYLIQQQYRFPVINKWYVSSKQIIINNLQTLSPVDLVGDGRCDSPGFNAKYCTYSFMDPLTDKIVDFALIHVSQCTSSSTMEKFGFVQLLNEIETKGVSISKITTDRHIQIRAYLKHVRPDIRHSFDVWHVSKNIKKKLTKKSQTTVCNALAHVDQI